MKKFLLFMLMMIGMVTNVTLVTSCDNHHKTTSSHFSKRDSVEIAKIAKAVITDNSSAIEFNDPQEFLIYVVHHRDKSSAEQLVYSLNDNILSGITYALSAKKVPISVLTVADEYMSKKDFYDGVSRGLPPERAEMSTPPITCNTDTMKGGNNG